VSLAGARVPAVGVRVRVAAAGIPRRLPHEEVVVRQGEPLECLFLVTRGVVRLSSVTPEGREVVVGLLGAGDVFGESALLGEPSRVQARVVGTTDVVTIPLDHLWEVLRHHPGTAEELLRLIAARLHRTSQALEEALAGDLPARLSSRLRDLAESHGAQTPDGVVICLPLTQEELARMVGASREAVNRTLAGFAARGLVRSKDRTVVVRDLAALDTPARP
jgi:CRP/FNR family transcriptional regulator